LYDEHNIEIGDRLGPLKENCWRRFDGVWRATENIDILAKALKQLI